MCWSSSTICCLALVNKFTFGSSSWNFLLLTLGLGGAVIFSATGATDCGFISIGLMTGLISGAGILARTFGSPLAPAQATGATAPPAKPVPPAIATSLGLICPVLIS